MASWPETKPLSEQNLSDLVDRIIQAEQNVEDGKGVIADAIVEMNQNANVTMTHSQLAALIRAISTDANASLNDVLNGRTFYQGGQRRTGTLSLTGNAADDDVLSGRTFYRSDAKTRRTGTLSLTGNATASQVLSGSTFYSSNPKSKQTGTMPNRSGHVTAQSRSRSGTTLRLRPPEGYFNGNSNNSVQLNDPNWIAGNILAGKSIFGLSGTLGLASGSFTGNGGRQDVSGLAFEPDLVLVTSSRLSGTQTFHAYHWVGGWAAWSRRARYYQSYNTNTQSNSGSNDYYSYDVIRTSGNGFWVENTVNGQNHSWYAWKLP